MKRRLIIFDINKQELPEEVVLSVILQALLDATNSKSKLNKDRAIAWFVSVGVTCDNFEYVNSGTIQILHKDTTRFKICCE